MPVYVWVNAPEIPAEYVLKDRMIDACIAPLIYKLNNNGVLTLNSCCGHRQDKRYNIDHVEDKSLKIGIVISHESIRHAETLGYDVRVQDSITEMFCEQPNRNEVLQ